MKGEETGLSSLTVSDPASGFPMYQLCDLGEVIEFQDPICRIVIRRSKHVLAPPPVLKDACDDEPNVPFTAYHSCAYTQKLFNKYLQRKRKKGDIGHTSEVYLEP